MEEQAKKRKIKNDIILVAALLTVILIVGAFVLIFRKEGNMVKVTVDGQIFGTYSLNKNQTVEIKTERGYNLLVIENGKAYVKEASCPDGICSSDKPISYTGESIICLPNKVVVSIENGDGTNNGNNGGIDIVS
jgi:hypothetical protein